MLKGIVIAVETVVRFLGLKMWHHFQQRACFMYARVFIFCRWTAAVRKR